MEKHCFQLIMFKLLTMSLTCWTLRGAFVALVAIGPDGQALTFADLQM
jgi:hypothetical protein